MTQIPSHRLLCLTKFPIKEILKDRKGLVDLLGYPVDLVADILQNMSNTTTQRDFLFAIDKKLQFFFVGKETNFIIDGPEKYIINSTFLDSWYYFCSYCSFGYSKDYPTLPQFEENLDLSLKKCNYCNLRQHEIKKQHKIKKQECTEKVQKNYKLVIDILEKKLKKSPLSKSFMMEKLLNDELLFIFTKKLTKKLSQLCEQKETKF